MAFYQLKQEVGRKDPGIRAACCSASLSFLKCSAGKFEEQVMLLGNEYEKLSEVSNLIDGKNLSNLD